MCENKINCSCSCTKKPFTEIKQSKKELKEGTWAPHIWSKSIALKTKNILQGIIDECQIINVGSVLDKFERKFWNVIGDDIFYDSIDQAMKEAEKQEPNWKNTLYNAILRIDELEKSYAKENRLKEAKSNYNLPKQGKYKHYCDSCDSEFSSDKKIAKCPNPNCGMVSKKPMKEAIKRYKEKLDEKINLKLTSNTKIELVKQAKIALDAMYSIYSLTERRDIEHNAFLDMVDKTFENISELLAVLISQESVESIKK